MTEHFGKNRFPWSADRSWLGVRYDVGLQRLAYHLRSPKTAQRSRSSSNRALRRALYLISVHIAQRW